MYDCIIIGAGPSGMTAAIYTARKKLNTLLLSKDAGGQMVWSNDVENYTGFSMITGAELTLKFQAHLAQLKEDLEVKLGVEVVSLEKNITSFEVVDKAGNHYYSKTVIIATGRNPKHLNIPGESKFYGKGVAVCATCDAPLYKGKNVVIIGGGDSAMDASLALSKVCKTITILNLNEDLSGDLILKDKVLVLTNTKIINNAKATAILGEEKLSGVEYELHGKGKQQLDADGVFIEVGYEPAIGFEHIADKNEKGEIKVDSNLQTSVPGLYAAGDINDTWGDQIIIACGEGAKAAIAVSNYLNKN